VWRWLNTGSTGYRDIYKIWVKIFVVVFGMAMRMAVFVAPVRLFVGDLHSLNSLEHQ
jgi:cytochrome bd-type quinol oxidase subunit 1